MKSNLDLVKDWIQKAESDLRIAINALETMTDPPLDPVCFHAQQCVEKYLKAFLIYHNIEFPHTHNLSNLSLLCANIDKDFTELVPKVKFLTPYGVKIRYPEEKYDVSLEKTQSAVETAKQVKALVLKKLPLSI